ncbi:MAG: S-layer homology domain-containing protein [Oscillospiraceae bacterium]|nr:S-layer homology domain-containing protein [Oscillospiraceae bacterium]
MKKTIQKLSGMLLSAALLLSLLVPVPAKAASSAGEQLDKTLSFLASTVTAPQFGTGGGEWTVIALARGDYAPFASYFGDYYSRIEKLVQENAGVLPGSSSKKTEYSRLIIALAAIGKNPRSVGGYDLTAWLSSMSKVTAQGINGAIFALIAIDSAGGDFPDVAAAAAVTGYDAGAGNANQVTRQKLIDSILSREIGKGLPAAGGFALSGAVPDPDITAMALQALHPYYGKDSAVTAAADRAVSALSSAQQANGGFISWESENAESAAQVIIALTALGIDPAADARFVKSGGSTVDALLRFADAGGGFRHVSGGAVDGMATDQAALALAAYSRFLQGKTALYDTSDVAPVPDPWKNPFTDVSAEDWFYTAVQYASANKLMSGVGDNRFDPNGPLTRAMVVTTLARSAGAEIAGGEYWWSRAREWGMANGVTDGTNMENAITREQLVTMMFGYAKLCGVDTSARADLSGFTDSGRISGWAQTSVQWAVSVGLIKGKTETELEPLSGATRAEAATIFMKYLKAVAVK